MLREIPTPPSPKDLAIARRPELAVLYSSLDRAEFDKYVALLSNVILVSRESLERRLSDPDETGGIRDFYTVDPMSRTVSLRV